MCYRLMFVGCLFIMSSVFFFERLIGLRARLRIYIKFLKKKQFIGIFIIIIFDELTL